MTINSIILITAIILSAIMIVGYAIMMLRAVSETIEENADLKE